MYRIAQEGYKRGILKLDEGLAFLHCFHPPSDALPIPQSAKNTKTSLKEKKHLGKGKKSGSGQGQLGACSTAPPIISAGSSILEMVRDQVAVDGASPAYLKMRQEAPPIIPGSISLLPDMTLSTPPSSVQCSSQATLQIPPAQSSVEIDLSQAPVETPPSQLSSAQSPSPDQASHLPPGSKSVSETPSDEHKLVTTPSDEVHEEAMRFLVEDFGPFNVETNRAQFEYPRTLKVLLKLVEMLKAEKEIIKEKNLSMHKEIEMMVGRAKMMEDKQLKAMERLVKSGFEDGVKNIMHQINLGNTSIKNELAMVLAEMVKTKGAASSLLNPPPPPGFGPSASLPNSSQPRDLRGVLEKKRATSPTPNPPVSKALKSSQEILAGTVNSSPTLPLPSTHQQRVFHKPYNQLLQPHPSSTVAYPIQPSPALPKTSLPASMSPGNPLQFGVLQPTLPQSSVPTLSQLAPVQKQTLPPINSHPLPQSTSPLQQSGDFSAPPPTHQRPQTSSCPTSQLPLPSVPASGVPRVPLPLGASQQGYPRFGAGSSYPRPEPNPLVASSPQIMVVLHLYDSLIIMQ